MAEELRELVSGLGPPAIPTAMKLSISVGVAGTSEAPGLSQSELLRAADHALYAAKEQGRNRVRVA